MTPGDRAWRVQRLVDTTDLHLRDPHQPGDSCLAETSAHPAHAQLRSDTGVQPPAPLCAASDPSVHAGHPPMVTAATYLLLTGRLPMGLTNPT
jgi:hypothetical protein